MRGHRLTAAVGDLLDRPILWFASNLVIYCGVAVVWFIPYIAAELGRAVTASAIAVNLFYAIPGMVLRMILPTAIIVGVLWHVRPASRGRFRLIAGAALLVPLAFAFDLHLALYEFAVQVTFALIMVSSRRLDPWA